MNLKKYYNNKLRIKSKYDGKIYEGSVQAYLYPDENDDNKESIIIDTGDPRNVYEFNEDNITELTILN